MALLRIHFWRAGFHEAEGSCPPLRPRGRRRPDTRPSSVFMDHGELVTVVETSFKSVDNSRYLEFLLGLHKLKTIPLVEENSTFDLRRTIL